MRRTPPQSGSAAEEIPEWGAVVEALAACVDGQRALVSALKQAGVPGAGSARVVAELDQAEAFIRDLPR